MTDTNNVRIVTPGGEVSYADPVSGGTEISVTTSTATTTDSSAVGVKSTILTTVGTGVPVLKGLISSGNYGIKSLVAGTNITLDSDTNNNTITINSTSQSTLKAGTNISLVPADDGSVTISATLNSQIDELSQLKDVDITTTAPTEGQVLSYQSGKWSAETIPTPASPAAFPKGSVMWLNLKGTLTSTGGDTPYLSGITNLPTGWTLGAVTAIQLTINTNLASGTAFPIIMQSAVDSTQQLNSTAKMASSTSFSPNAAMMDYDDKTGILNLYRINATTIFSSSSTTTCDLYIGFYILEDQQTLWS